MPTTRSYSSRRRRRIRRFYLERRSAGERRRARVQVSQHLSLGIVVDAGQLRTPVEGHLKRGVQADRHCRSEAPRPVLDRPERSLRPVECDQTGRHLRIAEPPAARNCVALSPLVHGHSGHPRLSGTPALRSKRDPRAILPMSPAPSVPVVTLRVEDWRVPPTPRSGFSKGCFRESAKTRGARPPDLLETLDRGHLGLVEVVVAAVARSARGGGRRRAKVEPRHLGAGDSGHRTAPRSRSGISSCGEK
jgi:hypothetical protein